MEVVGVIKKIDETKTFGSNGFRKRDVVVTTNEQYPQMILIEFVQDKCDILDSYKEGQNVKININIRGREWINPEGEAKYFNSIQGWRIEPQTDMPAGATPEASVAAPASAEAEPDDLPF